MLFSKSFKIILGSAILVIGLSATVLFPIIKDLNNALGDENSIAPTTDKEKNKTTQTIQKETKASKLIDNVRSSTIENPTINSETVYSPEEDTIKTHFMQDDIPAYRKN